MWKRADKSFGLCLLRRWWCGKGGRALGFLFGVLVLLLLVVVAGVGVVVCCCIMTEGGRRR